MSNNTTVEMKHRPVCDICAIEGNKTRASYDMKMIGNLGWGYVCVRHFHSHTNEELGLGKGQEIICEER